MRTFKSSLQALRILRERQEQDALHEYGRALQAQEQALSRLDAARQELVECWVELDERLAAGVAAAALRQLQAHRQRLERRQRACEHALQSARHTARSAFARLLAARQARTVVDKFITAQKCRYHRRQRRQEQKALDELASRQNALFTLLQSTREPMWN